jgi:histone-lysine N-methyltransferase SETMAR
MEFMQKGATITSEVYCETHDNARPHRAARTRALLQHFNWVLFDHPPYSPDLSPSDNRLFTYLKNWLGSQRFNDNEEFMEGVKTRLSPLAADLFYTGIHKLIPRYDKCLNSGGDYVEM